MEYDTRFVDFQQIVEQLSIKYNWNSEASRMEILSGNKLLFLYPCTDKNVIFIFPTKHHFLPQKIIKNTQLVPIFQENRLLVPVEMLEEIPGVSFINKEKTKIKLSYRDKQYEFSYININRKKIVDIKKKQVSQVRNFNNEGIILDQVKNSFIDILQSSKDTKGISPFYSSPLNKNYIEASNGFLTGSYSFPAYGAFSYEKEIDWKVNPSFTKSYMHALHGHFFLNDLIKAFQETNEEKYIIFGLGIITDWVSKNPIGDQANLHEMAWADEATARRLINWIRFFEEARKVILNDQMFIFFSQIVAHADLLSTNIFYSKNTNHGMFQDEALLVFSHYFQEIKGIEFYKNVAIQRLKDYFQTIISKEGVHLEHSPAYHQVIANAVQRYKNYFTLNNEKFQEYFTSLYDQMAEYATYIIKPNGKWPLVGDTFATDLPSERLWIDNPYYQYSVSQGKRGKIPIATDVIFPEAGYAVFRDDWVKGSDASYVFFNAAFHTNYHKHCDDLSVCIYSKQDIIVDSGPNGYDYSDPFTQYAYSSFAHNTLIVDGKGLYRHDKKYDEVFISDYKLGKKYATVSGINNRYENVKHRRTLEYFKNKKIINVIDEMDSRDVHCYEILWHIAYGIEAEIRNNKVYLKQDNRRIMEIEISSSSHLLIKKSVGDIAPRISGWQFGKIKEKQPITTIKIEVNTHYCTIHSRFKLF